MDFVLDVKSGDLCAFGNNIPTPNQMSHLHCFNASLTGTYRRRSELNRVLRNGIIVAPLCQLILLPNSVRSVQVCKCKCIYSCCSAFSSSFYFCGGKVNQIDITLTRNLLSMRRWDEETKKQTGIMGGKRQIRTKTTNYALRCLINGDLLRSTPTEACLAFCFSADCSFQ